MKGTTIASLRFTREEYAALDTERGVVAVFENDTIHFCVEPLPTPNFNPESVALNPAKLKKRKPKKPSFGLICAVCGKENKSLRAKALHERFSHNIRGKYADQHDKYRKGKKKKDKK